MSVEAPRTRDRILAAAIELFQARGYHGVGLNEILDVAEAPKGSLYHHYPNGKEQLAIACIERVSDDVAQAGYRQLTRDPGADAYLLDLAENIGAWMKARDYEVSPLIMTLAATSYEPAIQAAAAKAHARQRAFLASLFRGRKDAEELAAFALAALHGGVLLARLERSRAPLLAAARRAALAVRDSRSRGVSKFPTES